MIQKREEFNSGSQNQNLNLENKELEISINLPSFKALHKELQIQLESSKL